MNGRTGMDGRLDAIFSRPFPFCGCKDVLNDVFFFFFFKPSASTPFVLCHISPIVVPVNI